MSITPVILSGGAGTRLWPLSRRLKPKQFLAVHGAESMFHQTLERINCEGFSAPLIICADEHRFLAAEELRQCGMPPNDIILEPTARNTAPAIAAAALRLLEQDADAMMLVMPSDHIIKDAEGFRRAATAAAGLATEGHLVTFGVTPSRPETGYGYIRVGAELNAGGLAVAKFVEKPDRETAESYLSEDGYLWNAGIFLFKAAAFIDELERYAPDIVAAVRQALAEGQPDLGFYRLGEAAFAEAPAVSVDYAVMEKTARAAVVPLPSDWSDMGSWASLWEIGDADDNGNVTVGPTVIVHGQNNYIHSEKPLIAALGVDGLAIVATDDTVLVLPMERAQEVKDLVQSLKASGHHEAVSHTRVYRPWGYFQNLEKGDGFLVKRIVVNPGAKLSLQYHHQRAEHWVVVVGTARITNGDATFDLQQNQSTYIPVGAAHRLENPSAEPLHLIEVQSGDYIGEDDIVRLEDTYGRN